MSNKQNKVPITFWLTALIAVLFGVMTIKSGGMVLFTEGEAHRAAGNYVPFVLWFNFIAGFAYIITGIGLWQRRHWAGRLAALIAAATVTVFIALGIYIMNDGAYEVRTVVAMTIRSSVWITIALLVFLHGRRHMQSA